SSEGFKVGTLLGNTKIIEEQKSNTQPTTFWKDINNLKSATIRNNKKPLLGQIEYQAVKETIKQ
ncbi:5733_t:CDS:1, partial [Cetraspora pellucida]